jgi:peptidoglycan hydrolase CwlO-like protein
MSEEKHPRTAQEIQNEYFQVCAQVGDIHVKIASQQSEISKRLKKVEGLNLEMLESNAYYAKLQSELEAKKNEAPQG